MIDDTKHLIDTKSKTLSGYTSEGGGERTFEAFEQYEILFDESEFCTTSLTTIVV